MPSKCIGVQTNLFGRMDAIVYVWLLVDPPLKANESNVDLTWLVRTLCLPIHRKIYFFPSLVCTLTDQVNFVLGGIQEFIFWNMILELFYVVLYF